MADDEQTGSKTALAVLASLPVKGRAPMTGYSRAQFGTAWTDDNTDLDGHNGCDTRNDILGRDLTNVRFKARTNSCTVTDGSLLDPYTAKAIAFTRGESTSTAIQVDHVVPLGDAWQTGAQQLNASQRQDLANDPLELLAVDGPSNEQKGDGDAATWLPPNKGYRCAYVARQVAVKAKWHLWVTQAEHNAIARILSSCPSQKAPEEAGSAAVATISSPTMTAIKHTPAKTTPSVPTVTSSFPTVSTPPPASSEPPAPASCYPTTNSGNCYRAGELCRKADHGASGIDGNGNPIECLSNDGWRWEHA